MMRRKVKQLFAAGMALAVLATNLTPLSFAAETAEELQTGEVATQALTDEIDARALHRHNYNKLVDSGFNSIFGTTYAYIKLECTNTEGYCIIRSHTESKQVTTTVSEGTCTKNKVIHYPATTIMYNGTAYQVGAEDKEVPDTKNENNHNYEVTWEEGTADENGTGTMYLTVKCKDCKKVFATHQAVTASSNVGSDATCEKDATYEYGAGVFSEVVNGKSFTYDKPVTLVAGKKLGHDYSVSFEWTDYADGTAAAKATIKCSRNDVNKTKVATITKESTSVAPGCLTSGTNVYTASVTTDDGKTFTSDPHAVTAPATGHSYNNYDFHWDDETTYKSATLTWYCGNDGCDYSTQESLNAKETVIKPATCTDTGRLLHEVSFEFGGETECRKETTIIPALGHSYDNSCDVRWDDSTYKTATLIWECDNEGCDVNSEGHFKSETLTAVETVTKPATCTDTGKLLHEVSYEFGGETMYLRETTTIPALGHDFTQKDADHVTFAFAEDGKTAVATIRCARCNVTTTENVICTAEVTIPATCTEKGTTTYTATCGTASETTTRQDVPALGHSFTNYVYNGDATCGGDGTETAKCDRCDVTDTRTAVATAGCDLHTVDGAKVCAVCGKVDGQPRLAAAEANADVNASTIGVHLVVRVGTLPTGQKVITVAFLNNDGQAVQMFGTQKIHVSLAQLKAALGDTEGTGFEHTLTRVNTANGEKQNVGFTVENGTVNFDAAFNGSTACILLVD